MKTLLSHFGCTRRHFLTLGMATFAMPACAAGKGGSASYGTKVKFSKGSPITFPDFELKYVGTRKVSSSTYPRGFLYHDFEVSRSSASKTVSWSSGTGDIGPAIFQFDGKEFWLELSRSDKLGKLADNEVVIWKK
ncbi:hypothetical protein DES53_106270 [Roseimicrobium gellanilyticum]|uniref:Secreted protein n=1 Tax=Roseimicrobium gellanilyticum TaxID=748857 RepID=A0A366HIM0_9BACT|nr:hypothetical protein [Roseimicrobium gellanilyticum]RBP42561.1 hypothetical protein DES53_106270 [Roseimicrobium gellanilyticum]